MSPTQMTVSKVDSNKFADSIHDFVGINAADYVEIEGVETSR